MWGFTVCKSDCKILFSLEFRFWLSVKRIVVKVLYFLYFWLPHVCGWLLCIYLTASVYHGSNHRYVTENPPFFAAFLLQWWYRWWAGSGFWPRLAMIRGWFGPERPRLVPILPFRFPKLLGFSAFWLWNDKKDLKQAVFTGPNLYQSCPEWYFPDMPLMVLCRQIKGNNLIEQKTRTTIYNHPKENKKKRTRKERNGWWAV